MQDLSQVTGAPVILRVRDEDVLVKPFTLEDIGVIQQEIMRQKRVNVVSAARDAGKLLPKDEANELLDRALQKAAQINSVTVEEFNSFIASDVGVVTFFWLLLDRQYPGRFTREDMLLTIARDSQFSDKVTNLMNGLQDLLQLGNDQRQSVEQGEPAQQA